MADGNFRSDGGRDPLAELARLIGQGDASAGGRPREARAPARSSAVAAREADWEADDRFPRPDERRQAAPRPSAASRQAADRAYQDQGFQDQGSQDHGYAADHGHQSSQSYQNGQSYQSGQGYSDEHDRYQGDHRDYQDAKPVYQDGRHHEQGYQDQGYQDQRYQDQGYQDQRYQDQNYQGQNHQGQNHQDRGYADQGYQDQGYQDQGYQDEGYQDQVHEPPAGSRFFSGQAGRFNGFREEPDQGLPRFLEEGAGNLPAARGLTSYPNPADHHGYDADHQRYADDDEGAAAEDDYQEVRRPRRRTGLLAVMAVFSLVVLGSAGAFGYRAMFGADVLPTLPPIIKATGGPNKIALDPQAGANNNAAVATTGSTESLVSREEQPVAVDAPRRVVSTVPIAADGQSPMPPGMSGLAPATTGQIPNRAVASADPPWPAPPPTLPAAAAPAAASPPQATPEPKKIHTVTIRNDQTGAVSDSAAPPAAARAQSRSNGAPKATASAGGVAPMSIVPGQGDGAAAAAPPRTRTAVASAAPATGGGSYVQVTSRRTEGEAQTEFRALQAKFPSQLNGREAVIRRADLGEKGVFYRALVGPFASADEALQLCSGLKAAGGNCIVQK
jgi:SPOR domain